MCKGFEPVVQKPVYAFHEERRKQKDRNDKRHYHSFVKESIMNAYEIKTGMSRTKISHLMDAETWMDAHKAVELGFADDVLQRADASEGEDLEAPEVSMLYSRAAVTNSLMDKIAAKCHIKAPDNGAATEQTTDNGRSCDEIRERLNFIKRFI